jgi:hypothetical protein
MNRDKIKQAYIECALWASTDEQGEPLESSDALLSDMAREQMHAEVDDFLNLIEAEKVPLDGWTDEQIGHDFWLSRNGHGAGFWDRGLPSGDTLHRWAKTYGDCDLYVGDDGEIYCH